MRPLDFHRLQLDEEVEAEVAEHLEVEDVAAPGMHSPLGPGGGGRSRLARHGAELETTAAVDRMPKRWKPLEVGKHTGSLGGPTGAGPLASA